MSYELRALVASIDLLRVVAAEVPVAQVARLDQGLALIPMTDPLFDALHQPTGATQPGFAFFPAGFGLRLGAWSQAGPIAYVEADFAGGPGTQCAAVWLDGRISLGPLSGGRGGLGTGVGASEGDSQGSPISQALRRLGARCVAGGPDEFDAVGLGRHRRLEDWLEHSPDR